MMRFFHDCKVRDMVNVCGREGQKKYRNTEQNTMEALEYIEVYATLKVHWRAQHQVCNNGGRERT